MSPGPVFLELEKTNMDLRHKVLCYSFDPVCTSPFRGLRLRDAVFRLGSRLLF